MENFIKLHGFRKDGHLLGRILVQPESLPETSKFTFPEKQQGKDIPTTSRVVAISEEVTHIPVGALVLHSRHVGAAFNHSQEKYLVINSDDVYGTFDEKLLE